MTDRLTPGQLRDLADVVQSFDTLLAANLRREAARREAVVKKCVNAETPCVSPEECERDRECYDAERLSRSYRKTDAPPPVLIKDRATGKWGAPGDAPPPPAPDDLVRGLRDRARHARAEGNATATSDAWHFEQAADAIEALRAREKRLREALVRIDALDPEGEIFALSEGPVRNLVLRMGEIARDALAGGNDDQGK